MPRATERIPKAPTGIRGLDEITRGGLPRGRATLVAGGAGSGKSVLALQTLVHGARELKEPGIFVSFEEGSARLIANAAAFGWDLPALQRRQLVFIDAQPSPDTLSAGGADLEGLLAVLDERAARIGAKRIVLDSLDVLLPLVGDRADSQRELARLNAWLADRDTTVLLTSRAPAAAALPEGALDYLPFVVDCVIGLRHYEEEGVSQRSLRVHKYRGSGFSENASPLAIGARGIEVAGVAATRSAAQASNERVSTGIKDLDAMFAGGYHRGSSVLVTGAPGSAKTTLAGAFAEASCARGERALFISFDSSEQELIRNLASVNVRLARFVRRGLLRIETRHGGAASAETQLLEIQAAIDAHEPTALVVDPISALGDQGSEASAHGVVARLILLAKERGITTVCSSLLGAASNVSEASRLQISTIADSWIHLTYVAHAGERNRALTVVKSRGTAHSNQVRELVLSHKGVTLADVYAPEGEVLMGALRQQRESQDAAAALGRQAERKRRDLRARRAAEELGARIEALQRELTLRQAELKLQQEIDEASEMAREEARRARLGRRGGSGA